MQSISRTPVYVVSLNHADDRKAMFTDRSKNAGLDWQFFEAWSDLGPDIVYDEAQAKVVWGRPLSQGELGCYSSHYALWQQLIAEGADQYLILEDDILVDWSMLRNVAATNFAASGIGLLRLYQKAPVPFIVRDKTFLGRRSFLVELMAPASGTQGYVITRGTAETLLEYCRRAVRPIDEQLDRFWDHGVPNFCLFPFPVIEESGASTIGTQRYARIEPSWKRSVFVRLDRLKRVLAVARRRRVTGNWSAVRYKDPDGA